MAFCPAGFYFVSASPYLIFVGNAVGLTRWKKQLQKIEQANLFGQIRPAGLGPILERAVRGSDV